MRGLLYPARQGAPAPPLPRGCAPPQSLPPHRASRPGEGRTPVTNSSPESYSTAPPGPPRWSSPRPGRRGVPDGDSQCDSHCVSLAPSPRPVRGTDWRRGRYNLYSPPFDGPSRHRVFSFFQILEGWDCKGCGHAFFGAFFLLLSAWGVFLKRGGVNKPFFLPLPAPRFRAGPLPFFSLEEGLLWPGEAGRKGVPLRLRL